MLNRYVFAGYFCGALVVGGIIGSVVFFLGYWFVEFVGNFFGRLFGVF